MLRWWWCLSALLLLWSASASGQEQAVEEAVVLEKELKGDEAESKKAEARAGAEEPGGGDEALLSVLGISGRRLESVEGIGLARVELLDRRARLREDEVGLAERLEELRGSAARLREAQWRQREEEEARAWESLRAREEALAQARGKARRPSAAQVARWEEEASALLLEGLSGGWAPGPLEEALVSLEQSQEELEGRLASVEGQLGFVPDALELLERREAALAAPPKPDAAAAQASRDRQTAQQEKEETAEAKQETQQQLAQAEAEASQDDGLERELSTLIDLEPRLLSEKFYILDRRGNEFSRELEENSERAAQVRDERLATAAKIEELQRKLSLRDDPDAQRAAAKEIFARMVVVRREARAKILETARPLPAVEALLEVAREDVLTQKQRVDAARLRYDAARSDRVGRKAWRVAGVELDRREAHVRLLKVRYQVLQSRYQQAHEELAWARQTQEALLPLMREEDREGLYALKDENFASAEGELVDLWLMGRCQVKERWRRLVGSDPDGDGVEDLTLCQQPLEGAADEGGVVDTLFLILKLLVLGALTLAAVRAARRHKDAIFARLEEGAKRLGRRGSRLAYKLLEIGRVVLVPLVMLVALSVMLGLLPAADPLVVLARVLLRSALLYVIALGAMRTLILPRWYREREEEVKVGAVGGDILDLDLQRAQFIVSTLRMLLLYTLVCQYSLFLVRSALGMFFVAWWIHLLGYLGYGVVIYLLLSRWKDAIAAQFERLQRQRAGAEEGASAPLRAVEFVNTHKDKFYGVLVIFGAFIYVYALEGARLLRRYTGGLEAAQRLQNFMFRKQLEMSGERAKGGREEGAPVPEEYAAMFGPSAPVEGALVARLEGRRALEEALSRWRGGKDEGAWALVAEEGMGTTTLLRALSAEWSEGAEVRFVQMPPRLTSAAQMVSFLGGLFDAEGPLSGVDALMEAMASASPRIVVLDDVENCFLRCVGGFEGLQVLRRAVRAGSQRHFWVMAFHNFAWSFVNRSGEADYPLCKSVKMAPWSHEELQALVEARTRAIGYRLNYDRLKVDSGLEADYESVQSARGYFRLLAEYARGNPKVAMHYWLQSLSLRGERELEVALFPTRAREEVGQLSERLRLVLAAVALHGSLSASELAQVNNMGEDFARVALHYLVGLGVLERDPQTLRVQLPAPLLRQVLQNLLGSNFLYD